jgi:acyl-homoserine lactone acylase PvdQ
MFNVATLKKSLTAQDFVDTIKSEYKVPANIVFAIVETGEIGYVTAGKFPLRKHKVG